MINDIEGCLKMIDVNIVNTIKNLNPQKVGNVVTYNEKYLSSSDYKAQVLSNQVLLLQGIKLIINKPA